MSVSDDIVEKNSDNNENLISLAELNCKTTKSKKLVDTREFNSYQWEIGPEKPGKIKEEGTDLIIDGHFVNFKLNHLLVYKCIKRYPKITTRELVKKKMKMNFDKVHTYLNMLLYTNFVTYHEPRKVDGSDFKFRI